MRTLRRGSSASAAVIGTTSTPTKANITIDIDNQIDSIPPGMNPPWSVR